MTDWDLALNQTLFGQKSVVSAMICIILYRESCNTDAFLSKNEFFEGHKVLNCFYFQGDCHQYQEKAECHNSLIYIYTDIQDLLPIDIFTLFLPNFLFFKI